MSSYEDQMAELQRRVRELEVKVEQNPAPVELATMFHETYERLAPSFGYETRPDTKQFDGDSANGLLMIAVCKEVHAKLYTHPPVKVPEGWRIERISGYDFEVEHPDGSTITIKDGQPGIMAHMFNELCVALTTETEENTSPPETRAK